MKPKALYPLAFVVVSAAMFVISTSAATAQSVQVSNPSGPTPVNPGALSATTAILNPGVVRVGSTSVTCLSLRAISRTTPTSRL